jgi:hypothetical protein
MHDVVKGTDRRVRIIFTAGFLATVLALAFLVTAPLAHVGQKVDGQFTFFFKGTTFGDKNATAQKNAEDPVNIIFYGGGGAIPKNRIEKLVENHNLDSDVDGSDSYMVWKTLDGGGAQPSVQNMQIGNGGGLDDRDHFRLWNDHHHTALTCPPGKLKPTGCPAAHGPYDQWWVGSVHHDSLDLSDCGPAQAALGGCVPQHVVTGPWPAYRNWLTTTMNAAGQNGYHQCTYKHWRKDPGSLGQQSHGVYNDGWFSRISMAQWTDNRSVCNGHGS